MQVMSPACPLATNVIQDILFRRYPDLFKNQRSVEKQARTEKNLHISLCKMRHGIPFEDHCSTGLFIDLLEEFVQKNLAHPEDFGFHGHRELHDRETRSLIYYLKDRKEFSTVRDIIPESWEEKWIYYVHSYVMPDLPREFLQIYYQYYPDYNECPEEEMYFVEV